MTPRERMLEAWDFSEVYPVPYTIWYDQQISEKITEYFGSSEWKNRIEDHILRVTVNWETQTAAQGECYYDVYGTLWQRGNPAHIIEPVLSKPSLKGYVIPDIVPLMMNSTTPQGGDTGIISVLGYGDARMILAEEKTRVYTVTGYGFGIFESAWIMRGYMNFFTDLIENPSFCHDLMDAITHHHLELLDLLLELPTDGIIFSDDYGDQRGVIIGPHLWREFVKPYVKRVYQRVHEKGKMVFHHTCGNVFDIIPDLLECGLDVLQSLQPEAMPVFEIKRRYGTNLRLWGGLGTQHLLPRGTPGEVAGEVRRLLNEMGSGGGYCFTSSKPIMEDVPLENALAVLKEVVPGFDGA